MKQQKTRELLLTTKVAQKWRNDFEQRVEELMDMVTKVDNEKNVQHNSEVLDVYNSNHQPSRPKKKRYPASNRPFEFLVFRN